MIRRQDSGDRGLGNSQEVGDHHLGQVLAKDQQAGHHLAPQGDTASGQIHPSTLDHIGDTAGDLVKCFLAKPRCRLVKSAAFMIGLCCNSIVS